MGVWKMSQIGNLGLPAKECEGESPLVSTTTSSAVLSAN